MDDISVIISQVDSVERRTINSNTSSFFNTTFYTDGE